MSVYEEFSIPVKPKFLQLLLRNLIVLLGIFFIILAPTLYYTLVFGLTCFVIAYYYSKHLKQEYEYILCDDEFAVYAIINNNKRKKKIHLDLQYLQAFTDQQNIVKQYSRSHFKGLKMLRRNFRNPKDKPYLLVVTEPDLAQVLVINASPAMAHAFQTRFPAKTFLSQDALDKIAQSAPSANSGLLQLPQQP